MTTATAICFIALLASVFFGLAGRLLEETNFHRFSDIADALTMTSLLTSVGAILTALGIAVLTN